jgi:hypothetical protein
MTSSKNPFEEIFTQIADLLAMAKDNEGKPLSDEKLDEKIGKQLDELEKGVQIFGQITEEAIKRSGLDEEMVQKAVDNPSQELNRQERGILEKAKKLKSDLEEIEREYERKGHLIRSQRKKAKIYGKKRKKKFKRLGGQGWMPL